MASGPTLASALAGTQANLAAQPQLPRPTSQPYPGAIPLWGNYQPGMSIGAMAPASTPYQAPALTSQPHPGATPMMGGSYNPGLDAALNSTMANIAAQPVIPRPTSQPIPGGSAPMLGNYQPSSGLGGLFGMNNP